MEKEGSGSDPLIPRSVVFAKAVELELTPSNDRFDRFRGSRLIGDLASIAGTNERGFSPAQAQRFIDLLTLCKMLGSKRPRASALAFWLCWYGATDVPPELVCEHVERSVLTFVRFLRRQYGRRRVPRRSSEDPERWRKAGVPWAKPFIKELLTSFIDNGVMLDILSTIVGLALRTLFSEVPFESALGTLKRLAFLFGIKDIKPEALRTLWTIAQEAAPLFTTDERKNALLAAVRDVNREDPNQIVDLVRFSRESIWAMAQSFPIFNISRAPAVPDPNSDVSVTLHRVFPPGITAVLALTRKEPHAIEMRENLRTGNVGPVLAEFQQIKTVRDSIFSHIRKEKV